MKAFAVTLVALAAALALASCGGGGSSSSAASGTAASPRAAFKCLNDSGLDVVSTTPASAQIESAMTVDAGKPDSVLIWFMTSPNAADKYVKNAAAFLEKGLGGNATASLVAKTIVVGQGAKATDDQVTNVEDCLTS